MATATAMTLCMTALAQDSPRLRTPRRALEGGIERRNPADIATPGADTNPNMSQGPGPGPFGPGPGCNLFPAPPSVGTAFNLSYFGPPPSATNESLVGPVQLLKSGPIDLVKGTITVPLYLGHMKNGTNVWYILSDVSSRQVQWGRNSLLLRFSLALSATRTTVRSF